MTEATLETPTTPSQWEQLERFTSDMRNASLLLDSEEIRYFVDSYYGIQKFRIDSGGQVRSSGDEPNALLAWVFESMRRLEAGAKSALGSFADSYRVGQWMQSIVGIGPVISAGFLAHLDIRRAKYAGNFWSFAGLNPQAKWESSKETKEFVKLQYGFEGRARIPYETIGEICKAFGRPSVVTNFTDDDDVPVEYATATQVCKFLTRRPWNAKLKTLCWKLGESFVKQHNKEKDFYGKIYARAKAYDTIANNNGEFAKQAKEKLERYNIGKETDAYKAYSIGRLPDAHIHARAKRLAVKVFLSHLHRVMFIDYFDVEPAPPYAFKIDGHGDRVGSLIEVPNWPNVEEYYTTASKSTPFDGKKLTEFFANEVAIEKEKAALVAAKKAEKAKKEAERNARNGDS